MTGKVSSVFLVTSASRDPLSRVILKPKVTEDSPLLTRAVDISKSQQHHASLKLLPMIGPSTGAFQEVYAKQSEIELDFVPIEHM